MPQAYLYSLSGGALIGLASALFLLLDGRIAGVSWIIAGSVRRTANIRHATCPFYWGFVLDR